MAATVLSVCTVPPALMTRGPVALLLRLLPKL
jgi:hypothetical protein